MNKNEVLFIRYENGIKEVFTNPVKPVVEPDNSVAPIPKKPSAAQSIQNQPEASNIQELDYQKQGQNDALQFYKGKNSGKEWVFGITMLATPGVGCFPAIACLSRAPSNKNLQYPDHELFKKNSVYAIAYKQQARKIKKQMVLKNYWNGCLANAVFIVALILI